MKETILIVEDQVKQYKTLARNFKHLGYHTIHAKNGEEALQCLSTEHIHLVLLDIMLENENGIDLLKKFLQQYQDLPVIMITGYGSIDSAVQSIKIGAIDYITKPLVFDKLIKVVENALKVSTLSEQNKQLKDRLLELSPQVITQNDKMLKLCAKAKKLAATDLPILITGENGVGKEVIADFIHLYSPRHSRKILKINCAAFPETLLDNELFGHEKGAYTGAVSTFQGIFERADQSSLFLDEIGDMPITIQAKILRTLQNHEIRRIGGKHTITVDVRFIAATNKDLRKLIEEKAFRQDLFYRLNTAMLHIPSLRERKEDISLLTEHFLSEYARTNSTGPKQVSDAVFGKFIDYHWPGNVRELKNTVNYAAALSHGDTIRIEDLPPTFTELEQEETSENVQEEFERNLIIKTLQKTNYNKKKTAALLNMSRNTLYNKLSKYGLSTSK